MKATRNKAILRYRREDLDALKKIGSLFFIDTLKKAEHVCCTAILEDYYDDELDIDRGSMVILSFRISWDDDINDRGQTKVNKYFITTDDNGDELRWCWTRFDYRSGGMDIMGVVKEGEIIPLKGYVFAEIPPLVEEKKGSLFIPNSYREQKTDKVGYHTTIKHIHPDDSFNFELFEGDKIYCEKDSDIKKLIFGKEILVIPIQKVLAKTNQLSN